MLIRLTMLLLGACGAITLAQVFPIEIGRSVRLTDHTPPPSGSSADRWLHGYLPMFTRTTSGTPPEAWMYDREGKLAIPKCGVWIPNAYHVAIHSVAPSPEGTLIFSAEVWEYSGLQSVAMIAELTRAGSLRWVTRTAALADQLVVSPAGVIWALGGPVLERFDKTAKFNLLSRYHRDGRLADTSLPYRGTPELQYSSIRRSSRIVTSSIGLTGFYNGASGEWVEFDAGGKLVQQQNIPLPVARSEGAPYRIFDLVMLSDGSVYAWLAAPSHPLEDNGLFRLDRQRQQWIKENRPLPPGYGGVYGGDGDDLITRFGSNTYGWFRPGAK